MWAALITLLAHTQAVHVASGQPDVYNNGIQQCRQWCNATYIGIAGWRKDKGCQVGCSFDAALGNNMFPLNHMNTSWVNFGNTSDCTAWCSRTPDYTTIRGGIWLSDWLFTGSYKSIMMNYTLGLSYMYHPVNGTGNRSSHFGVGPSVTTSGGLAPCEAGCSKRFCNATEVPGSNKAAAGSIPSRPSGSVVWGIICSDGYFNQNATGILTGSTGTFAICSGNSFVYSWSTPVCSASSCGNLTVANSDQSGSLNGSTGQTLGVACSDGFSGGGTASCTGNSGASTSAWVYTACTVSSCGALTVANSDQSGSTTGTTGQTVFVTCNSGYSGNGTATCTANSGASTSAWVHTVTCTGTTTGGHTDAASTITHWTQSLTLLLMCFALSGVAL